MASRWAKWLFLGVAMAVAWSGPVVGAAAGSTPGRVFVIPIREDIMPPLLYLVRRGVKAAMEAKADVLILDMDTNGGRVDTTMEIIDVLSKFPGRTITYVNRKAYSAGAFISVATQEIYMAPESVIGAAAPIRMSPGGTGVEDISGTVEVKMTSAIAAQIRAYAQKNGHNPAVVNAMVNKQTELIIDGEVINEKGQILTLTNQEAEKEYGDPPKPLLSAGTVESLDALIARLDHAPAEVQRIEPSGAEKLATWLTALNSLWLILGVAGIYLEFKTPGFGLPGIVGITAFAIYFFGSYIAGLSGLEWAALFLLGLLLVILELFIWPGTIVLGLSGALLMVITLIMAMVDSYPGGPLLPTLPQLRLPFRDLGIALIGSTVLLAVLAKLLPKTRYYDMLVSRAASGVASVEARRAVSEANLGREGVALSPLHPGGKARFEDDILDVTTQGEMIPAGARIRVLRHNLGTPVVEEIRGEPPDQG